MAKITAHVLLMALSFWTSCVTAADFPVLGVDISCMSNIKPAQCLSMASAATSPNKLAVRGAACDRTKGVLSAIDALGPAGTPFCSSYLHIPKVTTVSDTFTPPAVTNTLFVTYISTVTVVAPTDLKRSIEQPTCGSGHGTKKGPSALLQYPAAEISSACKCLNIQPQSTETTTITVQAPTVSTLVTTNVITTITTCTKAGGPCECFRPEACCGGACSCNDAGGNAVSTCFL